MHKLDGILHEYLFFGEEKEMEELKCFFLLLLSVIKHKICKHRDYNETREEQGKYLILLSLFTGHFHKLRNVGKIMEKKKNGAACQLLFLCLKWYIFLLALRGKPHLKAWPSERQEVKLGSRRL